MLCFKKLFILQCWGANLLLCMLLGKCSTTELQPQPVECYFKRLFLKFLSHQSLSLDWNGLALYLQSGAVFQSPEFI
jgi:hypothetical protein